MKFVAISDTHGLHEHLVLPEADVLIHSGDVSSRGKKDEVENFLHWFSSLDYKYKIFIAGNHDFFFENTDRDKIAKMIPDGVIYLEDEGVQIDDINIWGSPITPTFFNWAFNRDRGKPIRKHWDLIPDNTDILITHGPVYGILDKTFSGIHAVCEELKAAIKRIKPKVHISGHIHEGYGQKTITDILYLNASVVNLRYQVVNAPIEFTL